MPTLTLTGHTDRVSAVTWIDKDRVATASFDKTIKLWDAASGKLIKTLGGQLDFVYALAAHPVGMWLASGGKDRVVRLWDWANSEKPKELSGHSKSVFCLAYSADGKSLASCGEEDTRICLWDLAQDKLAKSLNCEDPDDKNQRRSQFAVAFHPAGKQLASCGADRTVRLWDLETGKEVRRLEAADYTLFKEKDKKIEREQKRGASELSLYAVAFSPDAKWIAAGGMEKTIRIWDAASGELNRTIAKHDGFVNNLSFSADSRQLFSCGHAGRLTLWDVATGGEKWNSQLPCLTQAGALSPDGSRVAVAGADAKAYVVTLPR